MADTQSPVYYYRLLFKGNDVKNSENVSAFVQAPESYKSLRTNVKSERVLLQFTQRIDATRSARAVRSDFHQWRHKLNKENSFEILRYKCN